MTIQELIENGYKEYQLSGRREFQKRVRDDEGTKYFINISYFVFDGWEMFTPSVQFEVFEDKSVCIELVQWYNQHPTYRNDTTLKQAETFIEDCWLRLGTGRRCG